MTQITEAQMTEPSGLECDVCAYREMDRTDGMEGILGRGSWAQAMSSVEKHVCGPCYRDLEPFAREGYWRRPLRPARIVPRPPRDRT